ncbi:MAG TPA: SRPBCC family protein [Pseudorhodoferax sp.]|nr:SRPBCC family protein [Pseudorhodoferax sp.]
MLQKVVRSTVIDAPIERVWAVLRDFNSHDQWHEVVDQSRIEGAERSDQVGCVRSFSLQDGHRIREQLLTLDDRQYKSTYCIVEATVPLLRYVATVTLKPVTDGNRTFWHWESSFATPPGRERELRDMVAQGVYEAGFANLRRHLQRGADLRAPGQAPMPVAIALPTRRVVLREHGGADRLQAEDAEVPAPGPGEVRIRQRAIGLNFIDVYLRRGQMPAMLAPGGTPGMEAAGSVLDCGEGVHGFLPDERVAYLGPAPGAYTGLRNVPAQWLVRLPPAVDDEVAAALLLKGLTADALLHDVAPVRPGARWLVHAAAGALGQLLCHWASRLGAQVIGTVSSEAKARIARAHGCTQVIVTSDYRFAEAVQSLGGADVIVDGLGRQAQTENLAALAPCGHWISLGQASGPLAPLDPDALLAKSATFSRPIVFAYVAQPQALARRAARLWAALADGSVPSPTIERFTLESVAQAHERLESRERSGALVLIP